ncbi:MAG: hypothetical protein ACYS7Y_20275 [Planctomycetota bacterium]|jgi:hypothetical protein
MADRSYMKADPSAAPRKLKEGDKIRGIGCPWLEDGREYRVAYVSYLQGSPIYAFRLNRGRRIVAKHHTSHVDAWVGRKKGCRIEILS